MRGVSQVVNLSRDEAKKVIAWVISVMNEYVRNPNDENFSKMVSVLTKYRKVLEDAVTVAIRPEFMDLKDDVLSMLGV